MPELLSVCQTSYRRGPTAVLRHVASMNFVQRLGHRALTGRGLGVIVHQHYGYRIHYELRGEFGSRSFERGYPDYQSCQRACVNMVLGYSEGLCECMLMRENLQVYGSFAYAGRYEPLCVGAVLNNSVWSPRHVLWLDEMWLGSWPAGNEQVDDLPRRDEDSKWCRCVVTSS